MNTEPFAPGAWVLPSISSDVPLALTRGASATDVNGAVFALEAHAAGVRLPAGEFTNVKETLKKQLAEYVSALCDPQEPTKLDFHLAVGEEEIDLVLTAQSELEVVVLAPLVNRLNEHRQGLGWFVYEVIRKAGAKYPIYDDNALLSLCEMLWFDPNLTDTEYADRLLDENGEDREGRSDDEIIEHLTAGYRPADAQDMLAGNDLLLWSQRHLPSRKDMDLKKPEVLSLSAVKAVLKGDMPEDLRMVVTDALGLHKQVTRKGQRVHHATPWPEDESGQYHGQPYGASCIAVWKWTDFSGEIINHFEECEMNGGESDSTHMHFKAYPDDDESVKDLVKAFKDVVAWHSAVGRLLKHFPKGL